MIDGPIIVITLNGERGARDLARMVDEARAAHTLEVVTTSAVDPLVLQEVSDFCDENDLRLRFRADG